MKQFISGDHVPNAGTYRVYHYKHRMPHLVNMLLVEFPPCAKCNDKVKFEQTATDADAAGKWLISKGGGTSPRSWKEAR